MIKASRNRRRLALLLALGLAACAQPAPPAPWTVMAPPPAPAVSATLRPAPPPAPRPQAAPGPRPAGPLARCVAVDGDTLDCGGERVRLSGLDTPERNGACAEERRMAETATRRMRGLVAEGVALERRGVDRYGRTLAVARDGQGRDVAQVMITEGLARPYSGGRRAPWCPPARWR